LISNLTTPGSSSIKTSLIGEERARLMRQPLNFMVVAGDGQEGLALSSIHSDLIDFKVANFLAKGH
jgi:hypothetical protein